MIPFPGESVFVEDAADVTGALTDHTLWDDVVRRAGSRTLTSGEEWRAWIYSGDMDYLEETGLSCDVSWAVEVLSGTVTVTAAEKTDATYGDETGAVGTALGSFSVTGPGTLLIPSTFTADQVNGVGGSTSFLLSLTATSGAAVVQQIKLRVWPAGGALGGWSPYLPAWDETRTADLLGGSVPGVDAFATATTNVDAWNDLNDNELPAAVATASTTASDVDLGLGGSATVGGNGAMFMTTGDGGVHQTAHATDSPALLLFPGATDAELANSNPLGAESTDYDYIRVPTEVRDEPAAIAFADLSAPATFSWDSPALDINVTASSDTEANPGEYSGVTVAATVGEYDTTYVNPSFRRLADFTPTWSAAADVVSDAVGVTVSASVGLPASGRDILALLTWSGAVALPDFSSFYASTFAGPSVDILYGTTTTTLDGTIHHPTYRVWDPFALPEHPLRLMQRGDGLGMGSGRVYSTGTRQNSSRVYGSI